MVRTYKKCENCAKDKPEDAHKKCAACRRFFAALSAGKVQIFQTSDPEADNYLPSLHEVQNLFGSVNLARLQANVPLLIHVGRGQWKEVPVGEEAEWMLGHAHGRNRG